MAYKNIIFDFGGVLVDWNPRYLYQDHFKDPEQMEWFLKNICTDEWNIEQDRGRTLSEATAMLQRQFPEHHDAIGLYYGKWETMLRGEIPGTVALLHRLKEKGFPLYGLTNWSAETIGIAYRRFAFFGLFDGIVVSGTEKLIKPDPAIYRLLFERYKLKAEECIFIDDNIHNVNAARGLGIHAIHFKDPVQLENELAAVVSL
ncbi:HAD family hydrolase [Flavobacterium magnum]|uniref:HAD family hydrolase n=1 Tax=Flavobacterium magnum TaxID=2162713 RepID=A0A2S0RB07_9FLAO|nr:HAD family phosphatase [Flavobacterium magnum]AWA28826.1 HAD family hydrolase [Flavobacterium magnum]